MKKNMKKAFSLFLLASLCSFSTNVFSQNYRIELNLESTVDTVYLAHYFDGRIFADDTIVAKQGKAIFSGDKKLSEGIYVLYLSNHKYIDFLLGDDQDFKMEGNSADFIGSLKITGSAETEGFHKFQIYMKNKNLKSTEMSQKYKDAKQGSKEAKVLKDYFADADKKVREYIEQIATKYGEKSFLTRFAKFTLSPPNKDFEKIVPKGIEDRARQVQLRRYLYTKNNYFNNLDFTDSRFLRTPMIKSKMSNFFERVLLQNPDTIFHESVKIIEKSRSNQEFFQYTVQSALNYAVSSKIMGMDKAFVNLAKKYYLSGDAFWADSTLLANIKEKVIKTQYNLIGMKAQDMLLETYDGDHIRISEISSPLTVLYFWDTDCGHCEKSMPKLKTDIYDKFEEKGVKIVTICINNNRTKWTKFLTDHKLYDMLNCHDPSENIEYRVFYDVFSTPAIFLLDKDKKIIAKKIDTETLANILELELKKINSGK
ncbi:MAG: AhpC/TSA family protein [Marinifilaceae bacterium]|jgi:thiol-disulfide isomerase/thioredoxin|nr:AhpC/TSA family protein [Marinifilaceae bacterium]